MKPIKSMKCYVFKDVSPLHILFTEEDGVIVVRCLDFSISSHGNTIQEAIESMNIALIDYIRHGIENGDIDALFDPDLKEYWDLYMELEIEEERKSFREHLKEVEKNVQSEGLIYA
ncbi:hypothetical protein ISS37_00040 [candidate division KSB1 bacterium]|nr:hypothetical protein [candidate division KSB1 bacterium]